MTQLIFRKIEETASYTIESERRWLYILLGALRRKLSIERFNILINFDSETLKEKGDNIAATTNVDSMYLRAFITFEPDIELSAESVEYAIHEMLEVVCGELTCYVHDMILPRLPDDPAREVITQIYTHFKEQQIETLAGIFDAHTIYEELSEWLATNYPE